MAACPSRPPPARAPTGLQHTDMTRFIVFLLLALAALAASADDVAALREAADDTPSLRRDPYRGFSQRITPEGDTILVIHLHGLTVYPAERFKNRKQEEFYWRTVRDVKLTLPYAKLIAETLVETYEYLETFPTQKEREAYLKSMEKALFEQYKPVLKRFSKRQAKVLIKLIQRETHQSSYDIVKAFLGSFRATFWQGFGKLFGVSLKSEFRPHKDEADATLNRIARRVEEGTL